MKFWALFLAFYLLGLSFIPCKDIGGKNIAGTQTVIELAGHHHSHQDACTPLCTCSCCGSLSVATTPFFFSMAQPPFPERIPLRNIAFHSFEIGDVWQPPKLS